MPNSHNDMPTGSDAIRDYLDRALPNARVTELPAHADHRPILLLQTPLIMAGFGFSNGDMNRSYAVLYGDFKKQYAERRAEWDPLDLSFVFCVSPDSPGLYTFCSQIETNIYFCRKFVVPVVRPLSRAFSRLPFLPLAPVKGRSFRPPSAQTFLHQCGASAALAKYLVVPGERSPERILEDCISGTFGPPTRPVRSSPDRIPHEALSLDRVRLDRIRIQNFRAYRQAQTFSLGAAVTVMYGPNGFGKTSVFDAIDFATTGAIGRLGTLPEGHFRRAAAHLDSGAGDGVVSLFLTANGVEHKIRRRVADRKRGLLDDVRSGRKSILAQLGARRDPAADRVDNLISLFRATHLFSQEHQELAKEFAKNSELSSRIVSRLLAFEDYSNARTKASRVSKEIRAIVDGEERHIRGLRAEIQESEDELDRFGRRVRSDVEASELEDALQSLCRRVTAAGIAVPPDTPDAPTLRAWRATFETRTAQVQAKRARCSALIQDVLELPKASAELEVLRAQTSKAEGALASARERQKVCGERQQAALRDVAAKRERRDALRARFHSLAWLRKSAPSYAAQLNKRRLADIALDKANETFALGVEDERQAIELLEKAERDAESVLKELTDMRRRVVSLDEMIEASGGWRASRTNLVQIKEEEKNALELAERLRAEDGATLARQEELGRRELELVGQIKTVEKAQSEQRKLLSQIQSYARSGTCPVCGQDHGTVEILLGRIAMQMSTDPASAARNALSGIQSEVKTVSASRSSNAARQRSTASKLAILRSDRTRRTQEIATFDERANRFGVDVHDAHPDPTHVFTKRRDGILKVIEKLERTAGDRKREIRAARQSVETAQRLMTDRRNEVIAQRRLLGDVQKRIARFREDSRVGQENIDAPEGEIEEHKRTVREELKSATDVCVTAEKELGRQTNSLEASRIEIRSVQTELSSLAAKSARLRASSNEMSDRIRREGLPNDVSENSLSALISEMANEQAKNAELSAAVASLELVVDATTTGAAFDRLRQGINRRRAAIETARQTQAQHRRWLGYFGALSELLSSEQSAAVAEFASEYGPRTSVIQKRLRSVFGFSDIEILSKESKILVRVKRQGTELRPTDYFSQSQQQTLLLGLFLTAYLSQTWSGLSTVFLDDPVTHFDDLNTYAFLDLIVGLFESEPGQRQFVISTCDEKFLQLARRKFGHLGNQARFYTFTAIGEEGPVVQEE